MNRPDGIYCTDCGATLATVTTGPIPPCPTCGSERRTIHAPVVGVRLSLNAGAATASAFGVIQLPKTPTIFLQSVIQCGERNKDGDPVIAVLPAWKIIAKMLEQNPDDIYKIGDRKWEEIIAGAYESAGFQVVLTPRSGDLGRDVIATKHGMWSVRILDQVKAYGPARPVDANDVRAMYGVLSRDQNASKAVVTTTSFFAPGILKEFSEMIPHRLELVNGKELVERLWSIASST